MAGPYAVCQPKAEDADYVKIAKSFCGFYYETFDKLQGPIQVDNSMNPVNHETLLKLLSVYCDDALQSFEGKEAMGKEGIVQNIGVLQFKKIIHAVTTIDSQPMLGQFIGIMVTGQLKCDDDDKPLPFCHNFVLKNGGDGAWLLQHEMFRVCLHNFGMS